ncbi:MAG: hypothetical protein LR015_14225 [Verrucomicrobia bacterium]|nr:hypothetical protein [Verrucomicrobiota bacterium]
MTAATFAAVSFSSASPSVQFIHTAGASGVVPFAVTPDGATVVGRFEIPLESGARGPTRAFRWNNTEGLVPLGTVLSGSSSNAYAVSADGSVVAGEGNTANLNFRIGFRKAGDNPMIPVFDIASTNSSPTAEVTSMSADGRILAGFHRDNSNFVRSFVWILNGEGPGGTFTDLGTMLPGTRRNNGQHFNRTNAMSADGRFLVGWSDSSNASTSQVEAFRFDRTTGQALGLGFPAGATSMRSEAHAISADGSVVAGFARSPATGTANDIFFWREATGMVTLGNSFSSGQTIQMGISGNGRFVVSSTGGRAFRWDTESGELLFLDTLIPELAGWHYTVATGASFDGSIIVGFGYRNNTSSGTEEAWKVTIPAATPPPIPSANPALSILPVVVPNAVTLRLEWENQAFESPYALEASSDLSEWTPIATLLSRGATTAPTVELINPAISVQQLEFQSETGAAIFLVPFFENARFFRVSMSY